jgi:hypothetical protein
MTNASVPTAITAADATETTAIAPMTTSAYSMLTSVIMVMMTHANQGVGPVRIRASQSKDCDGGPDPRDDARWPDRDTPERDLDPREVFTRGLRLASLRRPGPAEAGHYVRE